MAGEEKKDKKYFKTGFIIMTILVIGPFGLPLVWFNPKYSRNIKILITLAVAAITYVMSVALVGSINSLNNYYQQLNQIKF